MTVNKDWMSSLKNANLGDYIKFGKYPQIASGEIQPIEWQVLVRENNKILVISRYALEAMRFDKDSNSWKCSEIRKWLNGYFYNKVFNEQEKKYIKSSNLSDVGTTDNVFLLSCDEAEKYFANNEVRRCKGTDYSMKNGAYKDGNGFGLWWLRSTGPNYDYGVSYVDYDGDIIDCYIVYNSNLLVRPALWINI